MNDIILNNTHPYGSTGTHNIKTCININIEKIFLFFFIGFLLEEISRINIIGK